MKNILLKYFHNFRLKYDKIVLIHFALLLFFSILSIFVPVVSWVVAFFLIMLFPIVVLLFIVLQYDLYKFFDEVTKQFDSLKEKMR